jgi:hypothetical protein
LSQTAVWDNKMVVRTREGELGLQVVLVFGEGIDLPSHPPCMLAYRQVVALHPVRIDRVADRRSLQGGFNVLGGPLDNPSGHVDHPPVCAFFDDDRVAHVGRWVTARFGQTPTCPLSGRCAPHPIPLQQGVGVVGQCVTGEERKGPVGRRFQPKHQPAGVLSRPLAHDPGRDQCAHGAASDPYPGIAIDSGQLLQRRQMVFLLRNTCPQLVQLTLAEMQVAEEIVHDPLTVPPQDWQPMIHGIFVDVQEPSRGADTHPFRQGYRPAAIDGALRPNTRIGCACTRRYQSTTGSATPAWSLPMPIMPGELCARSHLATEGTSRHTTVTGRAIHVAVPPIHVILGGELRQLCVLMTIYTITRYRDTTQNST